jgi:hypothetical protein
VSVADATAPVEPAGALAWLEVFAHPVSNSAVATDVAINVAERVNAFSYIVSP